MRTRLGRLFGLMFIVAALIFVTVATATAGVDNEKNQVGYWCEEGVKLEPVSTPFVVPAPPEGTQWTLIVLKAGTTNETGLLPLEGQSYSHSEHENSHVILCYEALVVTTTTTSSTTSTVPTTTSIPLTTTTTEPPTTTTDPETTTSSSTTTTAATSTTTLSSTTTETSPPTSTSTVPSPTTTTTPKELPLTGANMTGFGIAGMALLLTGGFVLAVARAD